MVNITKQLQSMISYLVLGLNCILSEMQKLSDVVTLYEHMSFTLYQNY